MSFLAVPCGLVAAATADCLRGWATWRWAARSWPGGAYSFAAFLGVLFPGAVAGCGAGVAGCLRGGRRFGLPRPWRVGLCAPAAAGSAAVAFACAVLLFDTQDNGRKGVSAPPSWAFSHYPMLGWTALATVLATSAPIVVAVVVRVRRALADAGAA